MDSFNIISYFSVALNAEFTSFISRKNTTFTIFFLMYIFLCVAITSRKYEKKKDGSPFLFRRKTTTKGQFRLQTAAKNDHFARGDWGEFHGKCLFSRVKCSNHHQVIWTTEDSLIREL